MRPGTDLIQTIYDAAVEPERWEGVLLAIAEKVDGTLPGLTSTPGYEPRVIVGIDGGFLDSWPHYFVRFEEQFHAFGSLAAGQVSTMCDMIGEREYSGTEYYHEWARPQGLGHVLTSTVWKSGSAMGGLGVFRRRHKPNFGAAERRFLAMLMPHLQSAIRLGLRIAHLRAERRALAGVLDALPFGVVLLDGRGAVHSTNRLAEILLSGNDGFGADRNELRATFAADTQSLRHLVSEAVAAANGDGRGGGMLTLRRPSGRRDLQVMVAPLGRDTAARWDACRPAAAVFVSDPETAPLPPATRLKAAYGLTAAQANVAVGLAEGRSLREVADAASVQVNTVRAHLKEIFAKTDTRRQAELVRLLLAGPLRAG